jgi:hypothetical protein
VLALEDAHWADPTTLDLLRGIAERGALAPLFVLITVRPESGRIGARAHTTARFRWCRSTDIRCGKWLASYLPGTIARLRRAQPPAGCALAAFFGARVEWPKARSHLGNPRWVPPCLIPLSRARVELFLSLLPDPLSRARVELFLSVQNVSFGADGVISREEGQGLEVGCLPGEALGTHTRLPSLAARAGDVGFLECGWAMTHGGHTSAKSGSRPICSGWSREPRSRAKTETRGIPEQIGAIMAPLAGVEQRTGTRISRGFCPR